MAKRSRDEWEDVVEELARSGLAVAEFARRRGLNARTLGWWRWRLGQRAVGEESLTAPDSSRGKVDREASGEVVHFVPVTVEGWTMSAPRLAGTVEAALPGGVTLRFEHPLDAAGLRELAGAFGLGVSS